jgi:hypothetical protein
VVGIQRPIWDSEGLVHPAIAQHIFSLLLKVQHLQLYLAHLVNLFQPFNLLIVAKLLALTVRGLQLEENLVRLLLHPCIIYLLIRYF